MTGKPSSNIETMRVIATFLLVAYHAVGPNAQAALGVPYPHPIRIGTDVLIDARMPIFGFIAGWVYALRPVTLATFNGYLTGKIRRLIIPGLTAALIYWLLGLFVFPNSVATNGTFLNVITLSYIHFWFLQSIFILLIVIGLGEALAGRTMGPWLLLGLAALILLSPRFTFGLLRIGGAQYLAPFFLFGMFISRHGDLLARYRVPGLIAAALAVAIGVAMNLAIYRADGVFSFDRRDLQSFFMAFGLIGLLYLALPRIKALAAFGSASFTIYLYHVLGTSGARRAADIAGLDNIWLVFFLVVATGIALPVAAHWVLSKFSLTRVIFLGQRSLTRAPTSGVSAKRTV